MVRNQYHRFPLRGLSTKSDFWFPTFQRTRKTRFMIYENWFPKFLHLAAILLFSASWFLISHFLVSNFLSSTFTILNSRILMEGNMFPEMQGTNLKTFSKLFLIPGFWIPINGLAAKLSHSVPFQLHPPPPLPPPLPNSLRPKTPSLDRVNNIGDFQLINTHKFLELIEKVWLPTIQ